MAIFMLHYSSIIIVLVDTLSYNYSSFRDSNCSIANISFRVSFNNTSKQIGFKNIYIYIFANIFSRNGFFIEFKA